MKKTTPNILWDFRLFSTGYAHRGIGKFCQEFTKHLLPNLFPCRLFIWGEKKCAPESIRNSDVRWIHYTPESWKYDLLRIPYLINKYKIDLFHYWVLFGPLRQCGIGLFHPCKSIATVHDLGVAYWNIPFLNATRKTLYWQVQRFCAHSIDTFIVNSESTRTDFLNYFKRLNSTINITYPPMTTTENNQSAKRQPYFVALGGSTHKNSAGIAAAFKRFRISHPEFNLLFLGSLEDCEKKNLTSDGIQFEVSMEHYTFHLQHATALLFCSFNEGLGIPPLEAMQQGCPIIVSDLPPLKETCTEAALFVNPHRIDEIEAALINIVKNNSLWSEKSSAGASRYTEKSLKSINVCTAQYQQLLSTHDTFLKKVTE